MIIERIVKATKEEDLEITGVTLLSKEEYWNYREWIPVAHACWWLRSPGSSQYYAANVDADGSLNDIHVTIDDASVRPVLTIRNLKSAYLHIGDEFILAGYTWTVIGEGLAIMNDTLENVVFRSDWDAPDANDYEASDVKKWLNNWAKENGIM